MERRIICYTRQAQEGSAPVMMFAVFDNTLVAQLGNDALETFAQRNNFLRHSKFDHAAGDSGRTAALFEWVSTEESDLLPVELEFKDDAKACRWLRFPDAVRALTDGTDRRLLQLAVQYISAGGVDESVIAADFDQAFIQELQQRLKDGDTAV